MLKKYFRKMNLNLMGGFTLIEMVIAIGLFAVLATVGIGGFVHALRTERQAATLIGVNTNIALVLEQMTREIRTSIDFCENLDPTNPTNPCSTTERICFHSARDKVVYYRLQNQEYILRGEADFDPFGSTSCADAASNMQKITSDDVRVNNLDFLIVGNEKGDGFMPRITITLEASPRSGELQNFRTAVQTTVSARAAGGDLP